MDKTILDRVYESGDDEYQSGHPDFLFIQKV
jgi:hypothetical protein